MQPDLTGVLSPAGMPKPIISRTGTLAPSPGSALSPVREVHSPAASGSRGRPLVSRLVFGPDGAVRRRRDRNGTAVRRATPTQTTDGACERTKQSSSSRQLRSQSSSGASRRGAEVGALTAALRDGASGTAQAGVMQPRQRRSIATAAEPRRPARPSQERSGGSSARSSSASPSKVSSATASASVSSAAASPAAQAGSSSKAGSTHHDGLSSLT